ncbi:MAG: pitrilysin family protein [Elusimicrobiota bacterium]
MDIKRSVLILMAFLTLAGFSPLKGFRKYILKNGLTVYLKSDNKLPIVSVHLWVKAGSVDETKQNNGVSHFLEHMLFKGTTNYPVGEISRTIESHGGIINAATSKEFTFYYIDISTSGYLPALRIIADIAQNATFPEDELERERKVILEEIKRSEDNPENVLYENFNGLLFTATPYKYRVIGTTKSVLGLSRDDIIAYYRKQYVPRNMVLVICGNIDRAQTRKYVKDLFGGLTGTTKTQRSQMIEPVKPPSLKKSTKDVSQTYLLSGFLGPEIDSRYQHTADILAIVLGSGRSSRLYKNLRERKQMVYSIGSGFYSQAGSGIFYVSAVCDAEKKEDVIKEIKSELETALNERIDTAEIDKAKEIVRSGWYFSFETYNQQAHTVGYWALLDRIKFVREYLKNIERVGPDDLKRFLKIYYTGLATSIIEPAKAPESTAK